MRTVIRRPVIKRCPFRDETDAGTLEITFDGAAPELHALAAAIDRLCAEPVTHEDFTAAAAGLVPGAMVTTRWSTGPWTAEVTEGAVFWVAEAERLSRDQVVREPHSQRAASDA